MTVYTGMMNTGEASVSPLKLLNENRANENDYLIDCPRCLYGNGSIKDADYCILIVEPSVGVHNLIMFMNW